MFLLKLVQQSWTFKISVFIILDHSHPTAGRQLNITSDWLSLYFFFQVEEIEEIDESLADPFFADAIENERELALTEEQKKNYIRVLYFLLNFFHFCE